MAALETLALTRLARACEATDGTLLVESLVGVVPGKRLYLDRELAAVVALGLGHEVVVQRGVDGTGAARHAKDGYVVVGRADQYRDTDPLGIPATEASVQPWINVTTGRVWLAELAADGQTYWQDVSMTHGIDGLGFATLDYVPSVPVP